MAVKKEESLSSDKKVLLIGDIGKAFYNSSSVERNLSANCEMVTMPSLGDAIGAAVLEDCAAIAVVMSGNILKLNSGIKAIRNTCDSRIILLAQMYEEPIAIRMACSSYNGMPLVDGYMICPVLADEFVKFLLNPNSSRAVETEKSPVIDPVIETRIRHLEKLATEAGKSKIMVNTVATGPAFALLGFDLQPLLDRFEEEFGKKGKEVIENNRKSATAGYRYVQENFKGQSTHKIPPAPPDGNRRRPE